MYFKLIVIQDNKGFINNDKFKSPGNDTATSTDQLTILLYTIVY